MRPRRTRAQGCCGSGSEIPIQAIRDVLAPFGALRRQPASDRTGKVTLPPALARFYEEAGPCGEDGPHGPEGLTIPTTGNPFAIVPLARLWGRQASYRWQRPPPALTGR